MQLVFGLSRYGRQGTIDGAQWYRSGTRSKPWGSAVLFEPHAQERMTGLNLAECSTQRLLGEFTGKLAMHYEIQGTNFIRDAEGLFHGAQGTLIRFKVGCHMDAPDAWLS
jgi:hypothetical protein